jgi:class 3 adenylate cyclase
MIPTGTVTFRFTDIEGSTKLAQQYPDAMPALLARHHEILNQSIQAHNGFVFQIKGTPFTPRACISTRCTGASRNVPTVENA